MTLKSKQTNTGKKNKAQPEAWWMNIKWVTAILAILAFLLYSNSLKNGFVLDDSLVITNNNFTNKGVSGLSGIFTHDTFEGYYGSSSSQIKIIGGRYRPLSVAFFAVLYQVFGANPLAFHFWNVLLFSLCCAFLYRVLRHIFQPTLGISGAALFSGLTVLFFTVHPIHTEVVDNIKSNDEILCLLLSLASLYLAVRYWDTQKKTLAYFSGIALFLACLAKENGVVFLAIIPLTLYVRQKTNPKQNTSSLPLLLSLALSFIIYFIIRYSILGWSLGEAPLDLINNPFIKYTGEGWVHCSTPEKLAMIFWSLGKYLQLLVLPYALSTDYYPRFVEVITFSNPIALMSLVAYLSLGLFVLYKLLKKQTNLIIYGIGFFLIALSIVSNLFFPVGTHLAERFLFMPSVGFCIVLSGVFLPFFVGGKKAASLLISGLLGVVLLGFGIRTYVRNFDFKSNKVLFSKDIQVSAKSAKMQNAYGSIIAEEALNSQDQIEKDSLSKIALEHLNQAIIIHPTYLEAFYMRGNVYFMFGDYEKAISDYRQCLQLNANFKDAYGNYALAMRESARSLLASKGDLQKAIAYLEESVRLYPDEQETKNLLEQAKKMLVPNQ